MNKFFEETLYQANKSNYKIPLGAIFVKRKKIVGRGFNTVFSNGKEYGGIHAEISALNKTTARYRKDSTVFVGRRTKDGKLAIAKPCSMCERILKKYGVKRVWYSDYDGWKKIDF